MFATFRLFCIIVQTLGVKWLLYRFYYAWALKLGFFRRMCAVADWNAVQQLLLNQGAIFQIQNDGAADDLRIAISGVDKSSGEHVGCMAEAEAILRGCFSYYSLHKKNVGFPPLWNKNTFTGEVISCDRHWSQINDFSQGDIKNVWELSRFDWAFPLMRSYMRTRESTYFDGFCLLLNDWMEANPPNTGPNWKCGQEVALRVRVLYFSSIAFREKLQVAPSVRQRLATLMHVSATRIEKNLSYALSQNSNHGHTELLGLLLAGLAFSETLDGQRWLKLFEKHIEGVVQSLNFESGGCCMYSMNYHRMMLDCMVLMVSASRNYDYKLPRVIYTRLSQAADLLYELIDFKDGRVPMFGSNDGARILPLSESDYHDFRPLLQSLFWATQDQRSFGKGAWNEALVWLGASQDELLQYEEVFSPEQQALFDASVSGIISIRRGDLQMCLRAGAQKYRPGHMNHLALFLKWKGQDILVDPGTYSYNAPAPFDHLFKETSLQNTAFVEGVSQMKTVGRFLALPWLSSSILSMKPDSIELEFTGFPDVRGGVRHRRSISWTSSEIVVEDRIDSKVAVAQGIHWLLPDFEEKESHRASFRFRNSNVEAKLVIEGPEGCEVECIRKSENGRWGYRSRFYNQIEPALSIVGMTAPMRSSRFKTTIQLSAPSPQ